MKISFWLTSTTREMTSANWGIAPMGGAEISAVQLGEELLKRGHDVSYFLEKCVPFDRDNLHVKSHHNVFDSEHEYFICVRPHQVLRGKFGNVKKILWSGDAFDQTSNDVFFDKEIAQSMDAFVFKSDWQREKILEKYFHIEPNKARTIYNGLKKDFYSSNGVYANPKRFIHTSTWYRGVANFLDIWPLILDKIPDAEIHVFSKTSLYWGNADGGLQEGWYQIAEELVKLPGMILREPVPQNILAEEMKKSWLMLYPNSGFVESSCGSAQQSMACGTPVIATKRAGLVETIGESGILVEESKKWKENFAKTVVDLSCHQRKEMAKSGLQAVKSQLWEHKAKEWENFLKSL